MIRIRFSPGAYADLDEAFTFYEGKESGLGEYFRASINSDIEGLKTTAGIHRQTYKDYHRLLSRVFPHGMHYTFQKNEVIIWAVIDCRRHPEWIRQQLNR